MKTKSLLARVVSVVGCLSMLLALGACGGGGSDEASNTATQPGSIYTPTTVPLGNFNVKCDQSPAQQVQQKIPYQQQQQQSSPDGASCTPQFEFYQAVATDFDVDLDCANHQVLVTGKGLDQASMAIPIGSDGSWQGQVALDQKVQDDGQGNVFCKVKTIVNFNGTASCNAGQQGLDWGTTVNFAPSSQNGATSRLARVSSSDDGNGSGSLPGIAAAVDPFADPSSSPSIVASPSVSVSPSASASPSVSPTACTYDNPEVVSAKTLNISIPAGAGDLGCNAYGSGAYVITPGTTVKWTNNDSVPHTVTADEGSADRFDSGVILPSESFTHVFSAVGQFNYHSTSDSNMKGQITVQMGASPTPSASPSASPSPSESPSAIPVETPSPSASPSPGAGGGFVSPTPSATPSVSPSVTPSTSPSPSSTPSPSVSPSVSPSPSASPSPVVSPSPSVSPSLSPTPSVTQVMSCVVVRPCPIVAQTSQKCPMPQQQ